MAFNTIFVFMMRFFSALTFMGNYYANNEYFPVLLKSGVFAITNISGRLASVLSPLIAVWLNNPCITVAVGAFTAFLATFLLRN